MDDSVTVIVAFAV